jgi:predicted AlkP superfamily pyrophosphatase or phosphodiesterase
MHRTLVINAVGLTPELIGPHTPNLLKLAGGDASRIATIREVTPAVTCSAQTTYLTGVLPQEHGIVGNGWYFRDTREVRFWHQSDGLVERPRVWTDLRKQHPGFTCANYFWWYAMYADCETIVTPRPMYPADGRKIPDVWAKPAEFREALTSWNGPFPLFKFWGPMTSVESSQWITDCCCNLSDWTFDDKYTPTDLTVVYLPHLDYVLQRHGPHDPRVTSDSIEVDRLIGRLTAHFALASRHRSIDVRVIVLSEYGISPVSRPIHINRALREEGLIAIREELGRELLDAGASRAFAVADHQIAHVYLNDPAAREAAERRLRATPGIGRIFVGPERREIGLDHPRAGDIVCLAEPDAWFTYYYWLDDARAPDFARTVDIHRKPGYDPCELFIDPKLRFPKLRIARKLLARKLGFRSLLDVIPLDATLVKGSHGLPARERSKRPVLLTSEPRLLDKDEYDATEIRGLIERFVTAD